MGLPRLRAELADGRDVARVLRGALRHEVEVVRLSWPPAGAGQHLLEVEVPGSMPVVLLADPVGDAVDGEQPLHVRPVTREQMATLLDLVERLDEPSKTEPPAPDERIPMTSGVVESPDDDTVLESIVFVDSSMPPSFGTIDTVLPVRASSFPEDALVGRVIAGKYLIESVIGSGASAVVFRATHVDLERPIALKVLHDDKRMDAHFVKRFRAEALAASRLEHPHVTRVIDFGIEPDGTPYLALELLTGRSLEAILAAEGTLDPALVARLAVQVCSALAVAHDEGIVHRDVKPENIMLVAGKDDDGHPCDVVKVCDFGLAKLRDAAHGDLTMTGILCGSPAYMSPEQARGEPLDARSDVYSLGVTMFEAITGRLPHDAPTLQELFAQKTLVPAPRASTLIGDVPPALDEALVKALAADRGERHESARALRAELKQALAELG